MTIVLVLFVISLVPVTYADAQTYTIPLLGGRWDRYEIGVAIPASPAWAHGSVLDAMNIWDRAQQWFASTYYPKGKNNELILSEQVAHGSEATPPEHTVLVSFGDFASGESIAEESASISSNHIFTSAAVKLPRSYHGQALNDSYVPWLTRLATHVFGHVLGLDDATGFCDLMTSQATCDTPNLPSSLDLYAIHVLAEGSMPSTVTLPSDIPYGLVPATAIPEFLMPLGTVFFSLVMVLFFTQKLRQH